MLGTMLIHAIFQLVSVTRPVTITFVLNYIIIAVYKLHYITSVSCLEKIRSLLES
jgi:hypothetical protein